LTTRIKGSESSPVDGGSRAIERVQRTARSSSADKSSETGSQTSIESVTITDSARQLLALQQTIGDLPDIDQSRVERVRSDIEQNRYSSDSGRIADRMLQLEGDLMAADRYAKA
jgi:negative regulator of flagellin synthesis FlgM